MPLSLDVDVDRYVRTRSSCTRTHGSGRNTSLLMSADMCRLVVGTEWRHDMSFLLPPTTLMTYGGLVDLRFADRSMTEASQHPLLQGVKVKMRYTAVPEPILPATLTEGVPAIVPGGKKATANLLKRFLSTTPHKRLTLTVHR